jgi:hypothetical protein
MYCSGCGIALAQGQLVCPRCGRGAAAPAPAIPGYEVQLASFSSQLCALSTVWFIYAGLSLALGVAVMVFANAVLAGHFGSWLHGQGADGDWPFAHLWLGAFFLRFAWVFIIGRATLAFAAGWGLRTRAPWGRIVAIIAAFLSLRRFPLGTALGIWTLIMMLGYRNSTLYEQTAASH